MLGIVANNDPRKGANNIREFLDYIGHCCALAVNDSSQFGLGR